MKICPCGSNFIFTDCCAPLIRGTGFPDTAEDLMRSRYTAFTLKNWLYLVITSHPEEKKELAKDEEIIKILAKIEVLYILDIYAAGEKSISNINSKNKARIKNSEYKTELSKQENKLKKEVF